MISKKLVEAVLQEDLYGDPEIKDQKVNYSVEDMQGMSDNDTLMIENDDGIIVDKSTNKDKSLIIGFIILFATINSIIGLYFIEKIRLFIWYIVDYTPSKDLNTMNDLIFIFGGSMVAFSFTLAITWSLALITISKINSRLK